jgi:hypothetical protein
MNEAFLLAFFQGIAVGLILSLLGITIVFCWKDIKRVLKKVLESKKKQETPVKHYGGVFDWCSPEEFEEGLRLWLDRHWDEIVEDIKKKKVETEKHE